MLFFELFPLFFMFVMLVIGIALFVVDRRARQEEDAADRIDQDVIRTQPVPLEVRERRRAMARRR